VSRDAPLPVTAPDVELEVPRVTRSQRPEGELQVAQALPTPPAAPAASEAPALPTPNSLLGGMDPGASNRLMVNVRAWVNGAPIFDDDVLKGILQKYGRQLMVLPPDKRAEAQAKVFNEELNQMIERELILQDAHRKLSQNPQLLAKIKAAAQKHANKAVTDLVKRNGFELKQVKATAGGQEMIDYFKRQAEREFIAQEYIRSRIFPHLTVDFSQLKEWYDRHANEFRTVDKVKWQDIFIANGNHGSSAEARRVAEGIIDRVRRGEPFENVLKLDEGLSYSKLHGDGMGQLRGDIQPQELAKYLFEMKEGQVGPLVELSTGFHVFRLVKRDHAGQLPFDDKVQQQITVRLKNQIAEREYRRIVKELKERSVIIIERGTPK
jgi:parvulin-like peptidyl-prolyl isomerase